MSPEEIERTMQFLLNQQAQFAADFANLTAKTDRMADAIIGLTGIVGSVIEQVNRLADSHAKLAAAQQQTDEQLRTTDEQLKATDARLDALIELFERQLREKNEPPPS
jgi:ABC-type transporter Mla subunit MlaD